jgi:beta-N-acetylhexosaminidase
MNDDSAHQIVSVHLEGRSGMIEQTQQTESGEPGYVSYINAHADRATLALFGNPYNIAQFEKVPTIIVGYENEPEAQEAIAEVILGERNATGILPVTP